MVCCGPSAVLGEVWPQAMRIVWTIAKQEQPEAL